MIPGEIRLIEEEVLYQGFNRLRRLVFQYPRYDGTWSNPVDREVLERADATVVLPYDPVHDRVVLIEQFRLAASLTPFSARQFEPIGGLIEPGNGPEMVIRREAVEEAGLTLGALIPIGRFLPSPGCLTEVVHAYCALVDTEGLGGLHGCANEDEDIMVHVLDFADVERSLAAGEFGYMVMALCVYWLIANRERLRAEV